MSNYQNQKDRFMNRTGSSSSNSNSSSSTFENVVGYIMMFIAIMCTFGAFIFGIISLLF